MGYRSVIGHRPGTGRGSTVAAGMSGADDATGRGSEVSADVAPTLGRAARIAELALAGLAEDEDELLGDLTEGRVQVEATSGPVLARRWWRTQVVRAVPRLVIHAAARHAGWLLLGGLAGAVAGLAVTTALGAGITARAGDSPVTTRTFVLAVVGHGLALLLAGVAGGAIAALVSRRAPLLAAAGLGALNGLSWLSHPYYSAYGPGRPAPDGGSVIAFSPTSPDLLFPVLWELPTMAILIPAATVLGGLLAVGWMHSRPRAAAA